MRAAVLYPDGRVETEDRPTPQPAPGDVLVQVSAVGVCGSDTHYLRHGRIGDFVVTEPLILGHEAAGVITAVGDGVAATRIGQRVSIEPQRPDPSSVETQRGDYHLCPHMRFFGTPPVDGALAQQVTIGADFAHPISDGISDEAAALCEPLSVGIAALRKAGIDCDSSVAPADTSVLIAGAGPIGLVCAQVAAAAGVQHIVVSEPDARRRAAALDFGATDTIDPLAVTEEVLGGFDAFVDASGAARAIDAGIRALRPAGRAVLVGMGADSVALPLSVIQNREIVLTGVFRYAHTWPTALRLLADGAVNLDAMVTGRYGLDQTLDALNADQLPGTIKAVVYPQQSEMDSHVAQ